MDQQATALVWLDHTAQHLPKEMEEANKRWLRHSGKEIDFGDVIVTSQTAGVLYRIRREEHSTAAIES